MAFRLVGNKFVDTNDPQFQMYNALGRDAGQQTDNRNFFERRASSIGNAVGTTLSAPISIAHDVGENIATQKFLGDSKARMKSIANKYGYDSWADWQDAYAEVKNSGDEAKKAQMDEQLKEFQAQANANANEATAKAKGYEDYRQNNLISKNINQDRGKFAGSAINTLSTMADVMLPTAGVAFNAVQGGIEGVADELEQNGLENFDWNRAGQNALVGTVTGGVVGGLNKGLQGISSQLARGGGNAVTRGLSKLGAKHPIMSNLAAGAARGALSGAVGGATGAGLSSALNGVEFGQGVQNALQGAAQGAKSGAFTGSVMAGANMALNATPGVGNVMRNLNQAGEDWKKSGSNFNERLTNTLTSGDSAVGEWLQGNRRSGLINTVGTIGNRIADVGTGSNNRVFSVSGADEQYTFASTDAAPRGIKQAAVDYAYETDGRIDPSELTEFYNAAQKFEGDIHSLAEQYSMETGGRVDPNEYVDFMMQSNKTGNNLGTKSNYSSQEIMDAGVKALGLGNKYTGSSKQSQVQRIMEAGFDALNLESPYDSRISSTPTTATKDVKLAEEAYNEGLSVLKKMSVAELRDELMNFDYTEADLRGLSKNDLIQMLDETLPYGAEAYAGGNNSTGRVDAEEYVRSLTPESLREFMINEEGYDPARVPKSKTAMLNRLEKDFVLQDLMDVSYKPKSKYQQEYLVKGQDGYATDTPTTAKGWLKRAGERIIEDANDRGVGLSIKDVAGDRGDSTTDARFDSYMNANNKINKFLEADSEGIPQTAPAYAKVEAAYDDAVKTLRDTYTDAQLADMLRGGAKPKVKSLVKAAMELPATSNVPEDVRNMKINDYSAENSAEEYTPTEVASTQPAQEAPTTAQAARPTTKYDAWDRLAQEYGYETYDDVINDYMAANPYAKINPNGMAGQILGWLDRQKTPTTLGGWVKKAGGRVADELNQRGAGLSIKDTAESPETEVYRTFNKTAQTPEEVAEITTEIPQKPTGEQIKNKRLLVQEIQSQFNTVDTPTARGTKPNETFYNLYEDYGLSDGDDIRQAVAYADPGSLLPKMISEAAGEAGIIDLSDAQALVMDLRLKKQANYTRTLNALEDLMDSTETTIIGGKAGVDALQFQRALEQAASDARGSNGTYHIGKNLVDETMAKNFDRIAKNIGAKLDDAAVQKGAVQKVVRNHSADLQAMRNAFPGNTKWQENFVDKVAGAKKISDLRHSIKDLTRANIYIRNGDEKFSTVGSTVARNGGLRGLSTDIPTTKGTLINRAVNYVADKIYNTDGARNARLEKYDQKIKGDNASANASNTNLANSQDGASTSLYNALSRGSGAGAATSDSVKTSVAALPTQAYNAIGRREGATNAEQARTSSYIADAVENANTLEDLAVPAYSTNATSVYNSIYGNPNSTSGDYWTSVLGDAMNMAMAAGDADAFAQLYSMYQSAASKQTSTSETKLTDKQRQANAAARALADFEQAEPNFGYDVSDIPVIGGIANWGGNEYQSKAEALALQIGYMLSGATVNKDEARKIGMSYVPQPRDSEAVRKSKLAQLRGIITDYQQTYAE